MSMKKKSIALVLAGILVCSSVFTGYSAKAEAAGDWVTTGELSDNNTAAPAADSVIPDANQYEYQKQELAAFCHFGPNTFNEIEWGEHYGDSEPDEIFKLEEDFDAETLVATLKDAGFKKLVITAKHHDGFCIWNSAHTEYDVESTSYATYNYDNMGGDILAEVSAACTKYDMDMGLYLSPWDIHEPSYGYFDEEGNPITTENKEEREKQDVKDYNEHYDNQLIEILSNPKYGNNGHFNEVWMDGAKGSGANAQEYDFQRWFDTIQKYEGVGAADNDGNKYTAPCMLFGAEAYTTVRWIGNESGLSNEETWSKSVTNKTDNTINSNIIGSYHAGFSNGNQWTVPETDSKITSGWFWGTQKKTPSSMADLAERYFKSVGYNSVMLLNVPPNNEGKIDDAILARVKEFGENVEMTFATNIAKNATVKATQVRGNDNEYSPANVLDGDATTYWTVEDTATSGSLLLDLGSQKTFDVVSIEESIEFGQRITSFKVEYSTDGTTWNTMDEGSTVGAKRLCRTAPVKAQYVKITVATNDTDVFTSTSSDTKTKGTVPMIAEVGVYKASEGFELAGAAPDGMTVIDITNDAFELSNGWTRETGTQYVNGTNAWANGNTSGDVTATLRFTGTKVYLLGTLDSGHGEADIYIDDEKVASIDTNASPRAVGQVIFASNDLSDGTHTLQLVATESGKAIGLEAAYVINNGGLGMVGIEKSSYTMNEDETMTVKLIRTGGTTGEATVLLSPNPGSAIQDDYDTECITTVTFASGETEKTAPVKTKRNTNTTGDQYFTIELTTETEGLILGLNSKARITIKDAEGITVEKLQELVDECNALDSGLYTADSWAAFETALAAAEEKLAAGSMSDVVLKNTYEALETAKEALAVRTGAYTATDRFQFPDIGETKTLEAEFVELHNIGENEKWPMKIEGKDWASNGKIVDAMGNGDYVVLYYNAPRTGTYTATVTYRSGSSANGFSCAEADDKIKGGSVTMGANDEAKNTHTGTIIFEVVEAGEGTLTITGGSAGGPQLDKIVIEATDLDLFTYNVTKTAGENGTIAGPDTVTEGDDAEFTITANEGYEIADVTVNGRTVGAVDTYTVEDVDADITIEATFKVKDFKYTETDPFVFPDEVNKSAALEAEYATLHNSGGDTEQWKLEIAEGDWASNGKFVNSLNRGDSITIPYKADQAGTYSVTVTYRSGNTANYLAWSSTDDKITAGTATAGALNSSETKTATFDMVVATAGEGVLTFAPTTADSPQLDKFDITLKEITEEFTGFVFPTTVDETKTLEAETAELANNQSNDNGWPMVVVEASNAGGGKYIDAMNYGDSIKIPYKAETAGTYEVVFTYSSGNPKNAISWSEEGGKINDGQVVAGADTAGSGDAPVFNTVKFEMTVKEAGTGTLIITPPEGVDGPRLDKFDITLKAITETPDPVNKSELEKAIALAGTKDVDDYTKASYEALTTALTAANSVNDNPDATQDQVDAAKDALLNAIDELVLKDADYSAVNEAIAKADALIKDNYKDFSAVTAAINNVVEGKKITEQAEVDAMAAAIEDAIRVLELKDADYTAVKEAIAKADALNKDDYKDFSAVTAAINNVVEGKKITEQAEVNEMAAAIVKAIDELELKETTPTTPVQPKPEDKEPSKDKDSADTEKSSESTLVEVAPAPTTQSTTSTATTTPTATGDAANTALLFAAAMFAAVVLFVVEKKKRNTI